MTLFDQTFCFFQNKFFSQILSSNPAKRTVQKGKFLTLPAISEKHFFLGLKNILFRPPKNLSSLRKLKKLCSFTCPGCPSHRKKTWVKKVINLINQALGA